MEIIPGKGARQCECRLRKIRWKRLSLIPPKFADVDLAGLKPRKDINAKQLELVPEIAANPSGSFFFGGNFGTGKSMFMWALYKYAVEMNVQKVVICSLAELLDEYRAFIQASIAGNELKYPRLNAEELRQDHTRYALFFDDIDKAKPTEYVAEQFFAIADAIYNFRHQVVVTTNLSIAKLIDHFDRADDRFGGAIVRRLVDNAKIFEMF